MADDEPKVHTTPEEGHPAGDGPRTDRDIGGPVSEPDAPEGQAEGRKSHGTKATPLDPHE